MAGGELIMAKVRKRRGRSEGTTFSPPVQKTDVGAAESISGWVNGKRKRKWFYGATEAKVQKKLLKAKRSDHSRGLPVAFERQTVGQYLQLWLRESVKPSVRPLTYEQYAQHVRLYIEPMLGQIELSKFIRSACPILRHSEPDQEVGPEEGNPARSS